MCRVRGRGCREEQERKPSREGPDDRVKEGHVVRGDGLKAKEE